MLSREAIELGSAVLPSRLKRSEKAGPLGACRARSYMPEPACSVPVKFTALAAPAAGTSGKGSGKSAGSCAWSDAKV